MIRLSIHTRRRLARLTLPLLIGLCCGLMLLTQAYPPLAVQLRMALSDQLAPIYALVQIPIEAERRFSADLRAWIGLAVRNRQLRAENSTLRRWHEVALGLASENRALKADLHWLPDPAPSFVTMRAVADTGGIYGRAVLLAAGSDQGLRKGQIAMDAEGLVGRVTELGAHSARVLLITDATSHIPVMLETSHASAMVIGSNAPMARLMYYQNDIHPEEGERVVTSSEANAFPAGLPVGVVHYLSTGEAVLLPAAHLDPVDLLRIFDYGLSAIIPPEAPGHVPPAGNHRRSPPGPASAIGHG